MWMMFAAAALVALAVLYLPGYLVWRACAFERALALCVAPVASVALLGVLCIVFAKVGIGASALTVGAALALVAAAACGASRVVAQFRPSKPAHTLSCDPMPACKPAPTRESAPACDPVPACESTLETAVSAATSGEATASASIAPRASEPRASEPRASEPRPSEPPAAAWVLAGASVLCGIIVATWVFVANIGSPDAFFSRWDNQTHLSLVRAFLDSGAWSSLATSQYLAAPANAQPYTAGPGFYPAAFHDIAAFACSATGASVPCGLNAVNFVLAGVAMPLSLFAFARAAFPDQSAVHAGTAIAGSACAVFPWWFFVTGPLYPNFAGLALVPAAAAGGICLLRASLVRAKAASVALLACCSVAAFGLLQPNALFYLFVVLASFGASHVLATLRRRGAGAPKTAAALACYLACIATFWVVCLHLPFMQSVVGYEQEPEGGVALALVNLAGMIGVEPLFALAALGGVVACVRKRCFWVLAPALFMGAAYVASRIDPAGTGRLLGGFWYTDFRRLGACFGFALMPLCACGLGSLVTFATSRTRPLQPAGAAAGKTNAAGANAGAAKTKAATAALLAAFFALNLFPTVDVDLGSQTYGTGFGTFTAQIYKSYNPQVDHVYAAEEVAFVDRAMQLVPQGALVVNQPNDGSTFAYAVNGLNTYYRHCRAGGQTADGKAIRKGLANYEHDEAVREALVSTGAEYVLVLDQGGTLDNRVWMNQYTDTEPWSGIDAVSDETPGFSVVLAEGDMRLYRIDFSDNGDQA